jgi:sporulation protein YlmC with PRC-barrel domain
MRSYRQIIGAPVVGYEDGAVLGMIYDMVIHPDTGRIEALWVKPLTVPIKSAIILSDSILEWKKNVYIKDEREIVEAEDIIKITEILNRNTFFVGNIVKNESSEKLGRVYDVTFDTAKLYLKDIYTEKSILGLFKYSPRIFSYDSIIKVLPEYILVKDLDAKKVQVIESGLIKDDRTVLDV